MSTSQTIYTLLCTFVSGSTCEGLFYLEENAVRSAFIKAIAEATKKCKEVSNKC